MMCSQMVRMVRMMRSGLMRAMLAVVAVTLAASAVQAQTHRAFTARYSANINGDISQIGNNSVTCSPGGTNGGSCVGALDGSYTGTLAQNGRFTMINVNADPSAAGLGLTNSTSADLNLPAGSTVVWAGLYWGARAGTGDSTSVLFSSPAQGGYTLVNAQQYDNGTVTFPGTAGEYGSYADVTTLVQGAGNGTYWVANINDDVPNVVEG